MNRPARLAEHSLDGVADPEHVIGERTLEPALLALGSAEVDDPRIDPVRPEKPDGALVRVDVVDLGRQHERRHEQQGRSDHTIG